MRHTFVIAFTASSILLASTQSFAQWVPEVLGSWDGTDTILTGINDHGHVVGYSDGTRSSTFPLLWTREAGFRTPLGEIKGRAVDINNRGEIVGTLLNEEEPVAVPHGFLWSETRGLLDLGLFRPAEINDQSVMAGTCWVFGAGDFPCVWVDGTATPIQVPDGTTGYASGINAAGDVVGVVNNTIPFLLTHDGDLRILDIPSGDQSETVRVADVNDLGLIVGSIGSGDPTRVVVWSSDGTLLHTLTREIHFEFAPTAISNDGVVIGHEWESRQGFVWAIGKSILYLNGDTVAPSPSDINRQGDIVGYAELDPENPANFAVIWRFRPHVVHVTTPNTISHWGLNTRHRLAWTYTGAAPQLKIEISRGGEDDWELIDIVNKRGGRSQNYYWTVSGPTTDNARLRVSAIGDPDATDINDADIRIGPASIGVILPRSRTTTQFGSTLRIFYTHNLGASTPVAIDVSHDGGRSWRTVVERTLTRGSTTSSFFWAVDLTPTNRARVRVRAADESGASSVSEPFTVTAASLGTVSE